MAVGAGPIQPDGPKSAATGQADASPAPGMHQQTGTPVAAGPADSGSLARLRQENAQLLASLNEHKKAVVIYHSNEQQNKKAVAIYHSNEQHLKALLAKSQGESSVTGQRQAELMQLQQAYAGLTQMMEAMKTEHAQKLVAMSASNLEHLRGAEDGHKRRMAAARESFEAQIADVVQGKSVLSPQESAQLRQEVEQAKQHQKATADNLIQSTYKHSQAAAEVARVRRDLAQTVARAKSGERELSDRAGQSHHLQQQNAELQSKLLELDAQVKLLKGTQAQPVRHDLPA